MMPSRECFSRSIIGLLLFLAIMLVVVLTDNNSTLRKLRHHKNFLKADGVVVKSEQHIRERRLNSLNDPKTIKIKGVVTGQVASTVLGDVVQSEAASTRTITPLKSSSGSSIAVFTKEPLLHKKASSPASFAVITAFSANHVEEAFSMLRSLIRVGYTGPIYIYLMRHSHEEIPAYVEDLIKQVKFSPLSAIVIDVEIKVDYLTYCFKPIIIDHFLHANNGSLSGYLWADTSTRYKINPQTVMESMRRDNVAFISPRGVLGMGESTHQKTYEYLKLSRYDFRNYTEVSAGIHFMNLASEGLVENVLQPYIDCAVNCTVCMAPKGSSKHPIDGGMTIKGAPSMEYWAHRQDQSVLSLLAYQYRNLGGNILTELYQKIRTRRLPDEGVCFEGKCQLQDYST